MPTWHILPMLVTIILQFLWISCQDFSFLISVAIALICGKVRPLCTVNLLLCFPQNSYPSSKIIICQISSQDMYHHDSMCNNCNWFKSLYSMTHFGLFVSVLQNWIQLHLYMYLLSVLFPQEVIQEYKRWESAKAMIWLPPSLKTTAKRRKEEKKNKNTVNSLQN